MSDPIPGQPVPADLVDEVVAQLAARRRSRPSAPPPAPTVYGPLHEAAAVLAWFDTQTIRPAPHDGSSERVEELLAHSMQTVDASGAPRWTLIDDVRAAALRQLREQGRVRAALAANEPRPPDALQWALEVYLTGTATPIEEQSLADLASSRVVCEWLRAAGFAQLPTQETLARRMEWLTLLEPFEHLAGEFFHGRQHELRTLRAYVGILSPGTVIEPVVNLAAKPPLLIYGPGGVGKSALLARFILEHTRAHERDRFPFAYLDFDRPDVDASEPLSLLIEAVRQLGIEYPHAREQCEHIGEEWRERLARRGSSVVRTRSSAVRDFARLVHSLGANDRPALFVLDTFEEVQWRSEENVAAIWRLLEELQPVVPQLRVCVAGRGQIAGHVVEELRLSELDEEAAVGYLQTRGIADPEQARRLVHRVGGNPLTLKLVVEVALREGADIHDFPFLRLDGSLIQRQLYHRILRHIHNDDVRKLAHPGLVLRRLTAELIRDVLAGPCGLDISSLSEAQRLLNELRREVSLVTVASDGALEHRLDLRRVMLTLLEKESPEKTQAIRERAIAYYEQRPPLPAERAEEIYHRLSLGQDPELIDARWINGVEQHLTTALVEFSGGRRAYLAARLDAEIDEETRRLAVVEDWERITARKARDLLADEQPDEALRLIMARRERTATSPLVRLEGTALAHLGRWADSLAVLDEGVSRAIGAGERRHALDLTLQQAQTMLTSTSFDGASLVRARLRQLTEGWAQLPDRLNAVAHQLALAHAMPSLLPHGTAELEAELRGLFDALPDTALRDDPALAHRVGAVLGGEDAGRLARVLHTAGLPRIDRTAVRQLAAAIASFDLATSKRLAEAPGKLARSYGVDVGGSLTAAWASFLLSTDEHTVGEMLRRLFEDYASALPSDLMGALASLLDAALRIDVPTRVEPAAPSTAAGSSRPPPSGHLQVQIADALESVFHSPGELREFLSYRLDFSADAIGAADDMRTLLWKLIQVALDEGWVLALVASAREAFPGHPALAEVAAALGLSTLVPGDSPSIDEIVTTESFLDPTSWRERLGRLEGQVCQVERDGVPLGTAFLVGVDLALTASHILGRRTAPGDVRLRFDLKSDQSGHMLSPGTIFELERDWLVAHSNRIDYALLRVRASPGAQPIGGARAGPHAAQRRWIEVPDPPPQISRGAGLVMVRHPRGGPLRLTVTREGVTALSPDGIYVYYDMETEAGSSGSPCFTVGLELVALHTSFRSPGRPEVSMGALMSAVLNDLRGKGLGDALSAVFA